MAKKLFKKGQTVREIGLWENDRKGNIIIYYRDLTINSCGEKTLTVNGDKHRIENILKHEYYIKLIALDDPDFKIKESQTVEALKTHYEGKKCKYLHFDKAIKRHPF